MPVRHARQSSHAPFAPEALLGLADDDEIAPAFCGIKLTPAHPVQRQRRSAAAGSMAAVITVRTEAGPWAAHYQEGDYFDDDADEDTASVSSGVSGTSTSSTGSVLPYPDFNGTPMTPDEAREEARYLEHEEQWEAEYLESRQRSHDALTRSHSAERPRSESVASADRDPTPNAVTAIPAPRPLVIAADDEPAPLGDAAPATPPALATPSTSRAGQVGTTSSPGATRPSPPPEAAPKAPVPNAAELTRSSPAPLPRSHCAPPAAGAAQPASDAAMAQPTATPVVTPVATPAAQSKPDAPPPPSTTRTPVAASATPAASGSSVSVVRRRSLVQRVKPLPAFAAAPTLSAAGDDGLAPAGALRAVCAGLAEPWQLDLPPSTGSGDERTERLAAAAVQSRAATVDPDAAATPVSPANDTARAPEPPRASSDARVVQEGGCCVAM